MRVEVVETLVQSDTAKVFSDMATERALKGFFPAMESDDSLFMAEPFTVVLEDGAEGEKTCAGIIAVKFREASWAGNRALHFSLLEKVTELLKEAGSRDSLLAQVLLVPQYTDAAGPQFELRLRLESKGTSAEQAALRWGLGLAHVQQALLFTSRYLRQQLGQSGD